MRIYLLEQHLWTSFSSEQSLLARVASLKAPGNCELPNPPKCVAAALSQFISISCQMLQKPCHHLASRRGAGATRLAIVAAAAKTAGKGFGNKPVQQEDARKPGGDKRVRGW